MLDFDGDLYGHRVSVSFAHHLRDQATFPGLDELVAQIRADVDQTRRLLSSPRVVQSGPAGPHARPPDRVSTRPGPAGAKGMAVLGTVWRWSYSIAWRSGMGAWGPAALPRMERHDRAQAPEGARPRPHGQDRGELHHRPAPRPQRPPALGVPPAGRRPPRHPRHRRGAGQPGPARPPHRPAPVGGHGPRRRRRARGRLHPVGVQGPRAALAGPRVPQLLAVSGPLGAEGLRPSRRPGRRARDQLVPAGRAGAAGRRR